MLIKFCRTYIKLIKTDLTGLYGYFLRTVNFHINILLLGLSAVSVIEKNFISDNLSFN